MIVPSLLEKPQEQVGAFSAIRRLLTQRSEDFIDRRLEVARLGQRQGRGEPSSRLFMLQHANQRSEDGVVVVERPERQARFNANFSFFRRV